MGGKRGQVQFAGTARRVLRTNWTCPLFPLRQRSSLGRIAAKLFATPLHIVGVASAVLLVLLGTAAAGCGSQPWASRPE